MVHDIFLVKIQQGQQKRIKSLRRRNESDEGDILLSCKPFNTINMQDRKELISERQKKIAIYAKVFSHPVRVYIIELLKKQTCCYSGDLSSELSIAKSTLSQHLKELKKPDLSRGR
jgi:hypothetical protein